MTTPSPPLEEIVLRVLRAAGVAAPSFAEIDGLTIPRGILVRPGAYTEAAGIVPELKAHFSSTHMTCLQDEAPGAQRWPLLNLVRQVLRAAGFTMEPRRLSDGYGPDRRKRYRRVFDVRQAPKQVEAGSASTHK